MRKGCILLIMMILLLGGGISKSFARLSADTVCAGSTLHLFNSISGATYSWSGPGGFTSTLQNPTIYPATIADSAMFHCVTSLGALHDTDSVAVIVHYKPVLTATNNSPLCLNTADTLRLFASVATGSGTYTWAGPNGFTATTQNTKLAESGLAPFVWLGTYTVTVTSPFGCKDTTTTFADTVTRPFPPRVTNGPYCQGATAGPYTFGGLHSGATVLWYPSATGGSPSTTPWVAINTLVPGIYVNYASQIVGSCESATRLPDTVRVITTPPAPVVTGPIQYCQSVGPVVAMTVSVTPSTGSGVPYWYVTSSGGTGVTPEPLPSISIPGTYNYWVSIRDSGCEGPRTPVTITIHPKPNPPIVFQHKWCQINDSLLAGPDSAVQSALPPAFDTLKWYGPNVVNRLLPPSPLAPLDFLLVGPDTMINWVTETSVYGCVSDPAYDTTIIKAKPLPPLVATINYCQHDKNVRPLNWFVDSVANSQYLTWYAENWNVLPPVPVLFTDTTTGVYTWHVTQTVAGCQGFPSDVNVTILYKPVFDIQATSDWVCQYDSLQLWYHPDGPPLIGAKYDWILSPGERFTQHTFYNDSTITVEFDSANQNNYIHLTASDFNGTCSSDTFIRIKVIAIPIMHALTKTDVCLGDTVSLALSNRADDAANFSWMIDSIPMASSHALNIVSANSNTGGPFVISWIDSGRHIIRVFSTTTEGCTSYPTYDSTFVHPIPDATFGISALAKGAICLEDSVEFTAHYINYNYSYEWTPEHDFNSINNPVIWGKMEETNNVITLKVTDPYGCAGTQSLTVPADGCCTLLFPNAFTPNGDHINDVFQPSPNNANIVQTGWAGYHRFHVFRIVNRWGHTIFESQNSVDATWDGTYNGVPQDMGVYYWYVKYDCGGKTIEEKGDVTLIR